MIVVSSPCPADGKSITATNLAASLAVKNDDDVLLIDADLRQHTLSKMLDMGGAAGLGELLNGQCAIESALVRTEQFPKLHILPAGNATGNPAELLDCAAWRHLCAFGRKTFNHVIIDVPPVGSMADYELVQAASDGVLLVIRPEHTTRKEAADALALIPPEKLLGVVLNGVRDWFGWKSHDHYFYYAR
jgi:receptor protein-tyrosine kinase